MKPKHLGQTSKYSEQYDPSLLDIVVRQDNRDKYDITPLMRSTLGCDIWNCYEVSFLLAGGFPVVAQVKITIPSYSTYTVESKSLKLYLNSFNMYRIESYNVTTACCMVQSMIEADLSKITASTVKCYLHINPQKSSLPYVQEKGEVFMPTEFFYEDEIEEGLLNGVDYQMGVDSSLLVAGDEVKTSVQYQIHRTGLLRSLCKVTSQPDWGSLFIVMKEAERALLGINFLKYCASFRNVNHFHEEVVELVYSDILSLFAPEELLVCAIYTRRGGVDICPLRSSSQELIDDNFPDLVNVDVYNQKIFRQ